MKLQCASLFEQSAYIGGVWVDNTSLPRVPVINPSTHEIIGSVPQVTTQQIDEAVACAISAFKDWREGGGRERAFGFGGSARTVENHRQSPAPIPCTRQGQTA